MMDLPTTPSFRLDGKRALVAGASSGIGEAAAVALAEAGAEVTIVARRAEALDPDSRNTDFLAVLGATYVMGNSPDDARRQLSKVEALETEGRSFWPQRSYIHGWLGEYEAAADCADHAFAERNPGLIYWGNHPVCDASRAHPRIVENLKALGFPAIRPMRPWQPVGRD